MTVTLEEAARRLREAYSGQPIAPLRDYLASTDAERAYVLQAINTRFWESRGRRVVGRKIGLTAAAVQRQLGVDQPDFGVLFADMQLENGGDLLPSRVLQPKAEAEVALVMARDVPEPDATPGMVADAVAYATAAIEIVDSRIAEWKITFADTVADNGSSAFFVLGDRKHKLDELDLYTCGMVLEVNGEVASMGVGAACLGHPLNAAAWLARTLAAHNEPLREGDIVLTGALGPMVSLSPTAEVVARIGGLGTARFVFGETR